MTAPARPTRPGGGSDSFGELGGDSYVRRAGKVYVLALYGALRSIKMYPIENSAVQKALQELVNVNGELIKREAELEIKVSGEFIFVNSTRLRLDLDNYASFSHLLSLFRANGIGVLRVHGSPTARDWLTFLSVVQSPSKETASQRLLQLTGKLEAAKILNFELGAASEAEEEESREKVKEVAKRTYSQSVAVTKELVHSVRVGRSPNIKKIKRVVQTIVDQILNEETSLMGLTTIRDYDEYTFTHSVNVCIFSVAVG